MAKNQANAKQHPEAELLLLENYSHSSWMLSSKTNRIYSKKLAKEQVGLYSSDYMINHTENKEKKWKIDHIDRPRPRHGHKYIKYKKCLNMTMLLCIKQNLSNIWSSIHQKVKQNWGWVVKKRCL